MKAVTNTSKRWRCVECGYRYISPIPVSDVQHKCKTAPVRGKQRKGMQPNE